MAVRALEVKKLREKTGAGMMDCKKALVKAEGDFAGAEKILKELGLAAATKRAGRATNEGRIFSRVRPDKGVLLEISCETDFVAKNDEFKALGGKLVEIALEKENGASADDYDPYIKDAIGKIKENIELRRIEVFSAKPNELLVEYIHGEGRIGVLVHLTLSDESLKDNPKVKEVAFNMALHTTAFAPLFLSKDKVSAAYLEEQEEIFTKQAEGLGKPEKVVKEIVRGKLNKYLSEICFLDQAYVKDHDLKVSQVLENLEKEIGGKVEISNYLYFKVGEELG